ncbi:MAG: RNA methyltransferase, partial [Dinghuibacter sp.]|nr:RNA methyltransferase [Dinghuibacter sp.]
MLSQTKVKYIQTLYQKKKRDAEGLFIAEGVKIINELLTAPHIAVKELFAVTEWVQANRAVQVPVTEVTEQELGRISALTTPNQVLAIVHKPEPRAPEPLTGWAIALSGIQDPGNLGTIIRTADWFGITEL